ncbi:MAG: spirocyclase, AveC family [Desulfobacterium sp.]|nr:spirocyclase, AveC family [Desulfobacterium sp.]MBU3949723.1 spirocyclase AveC family protein [Pseudomonadota bacterium]MBU3979597.1 spirocyclase AveC family protein [Patescibacteria group bacterium]MBU4036542.1 spirocyclase AveC family protein [Pseudomonadota bacterium]
MAEKYDVPTIPKTRPAVVWWAWIGGIWLLFWAYVLIRWMTGPYFTPVPAGAVPVPGWMDMIMTVWQIANYPLLALGLYFLAYKPWRRNRTITLDGMLIIAFMFMSLQDSCSNFFGYWYTMNSHFFNMGSFVNDIPGWMAFGRPGAQVPWAIFFHPFEYTIGFFAFCFIGSGLMNFFRTRFNLKPLMLIIVVFPVCMVFDLVIEGLFQTLGFYTMAGGKISFFPDTYEKFPLIETFFIALMAVSVISLRYFKNDKGETLVERGLNSMVISDVKKQLVRCLALIGATQCIFLFTYNIPIAAYMGSNPGVWPTDVISRPYWNDGLCGAGTDRLCPGPGVPLTQQAWVTTLPAGQHVPEEDWISRSFEPATGKALRRDDGMKNPELGDGKCRPFNSRFMGRVSKDRCDTLLCIEGIKPNLPNWNWW